MNEPSNQPTPGAGVIHERVKAAVNAHRIKLRVLTTTAFVFGFVAIAASTLIVWSYLTLYLPKQKDMLQKTEQLLTERTGSTNVELSVRRINKYLEEEAIFTHVISIAVTVVAVSVGLLGLGILTLLTVVVLNRRIALNQINTSLAQISQQLRELQTTREVTFHP